MTDNNFYVVHGWMINKLQLKGNELAVYAIIYGFSQDGESEFTGSVNYLADWCGATRQGIMKNLKTLTDKGYIVKTERLVNNVKFNTYKAVPLESALSLHGVNSVDTPVNSVDTPCKLSLHNNIDNNITNNKQIDISKDISSEPSFLGSAKKSTKKTSIEKPKKESLYSKCVREIDNYTDDKKLRDMLVEYLNVRLNMKDKPIHGLAQWTYILRKLSNFKGSEYEVVQASIEHGWASFYSPDKDTRRFGARSSNVFGEGDGSVKSEKRKEKTYGDF